MSREILYGVQFINLSNGKYIPIICSGSSNCTQISPVSGKEVAERHWWPLGGEALLGKTENEIMSWAHERFTQENADREFMMRNGKWMYYKDVPRFMSNSIKSGRTIEQIIERLPHESLRCTIMVYGNNTHYEENRQYCRTTADLTQWIDSFENRCKNKATGEAIYPSMVFQAFGSLGIGRNVECHGKVICKIKGYYLCDYTLNNGGMSYSCTKNLDEALVFESEQDFIKRFGEAAAKRGVHYQLVNAGKSLLAPKLYVVKMSGGRFSGYYFKKKSSAHIFFALSPTDARKFKSEAEAQRYIEKNLANQQTAIEKIQQD